jgi:hypothetical protein
MSTVKEIEAAIEGLSAAEQVELARWLQDRCDPDVGLELRPELETELDAAREEIARGDVADWEHLKRSIPPDAR